MMSATRYSPPPQSFTKRVENKKTPKSDINALILDYLTTEGYPNAAAKFSTEANLSPEQDEDSIIVRQNIQHSIHTGNIQAAIEALNELDPSILDEDKALHFSLLRLQLVELIRASNATGGTITPALKFATEQLGPRAPTNPKFLEDLEQTMALLLFDTDALEPQLAALLHPNLRRDAAIEVNKVILERQALGRDSAIRRLVKVRAWAESAARDKGLISKDRIGIGLLGDEAGADSQPARDAEIGYDSMMALEGS